MVESKHSLLEGRFYEFLVLLSEQDLNAFNEEKNTPLHWACLNGHIEVIITSLCEATIMQF